MRDDLSVSLKKNKLDLEHQVLLQKLAAIWVLETGFPLSVLAIAVSQTWFTYPTVLSVIIIFSLIMSIIDYARRFLNHQIQQKQLEVSKLIEKTTFTP
jgi:hypothetical protein